MKGVLLVLCLIILVSCKDKTRDEMVMVFVIIQNSTDSDGLYLNQLDPDVFYLRDACGIRRTFMDIDEKVRMPINYEEAYHLYETRYEESFYDLFPSDFNKIVDEEVYHIVAIDTLNKNAFSSKVIDISIVN